LSISEFEIIRRFFTRNRPSATGVVLGVGDDAAIVRPETGHDLLIAADVLNEGIHFPVSTAPRAIGHKVLAVNLSDLAAMGATPLWFTMTLSLPDVREDWLSEFAAGLFAIADRFGIELIGGDTVRGPLSVGIQVIGSVKSGMALRRDGAKLGDQVYVSGVLGDAAAALDKLKSQQPVSPALQERLDFPNPRVELGRRLVDLANSCIDVSDGLMADLGHILEASKVGARIDVRSIPLSGSLSQISSTDAHRFALSGGDDYELCFTVPEGKINELDRISAESGVQCTRIGVIVAGTGLEVTGSENISAATAGGFDHFRD